MPKPDAPAPPDYAAGAQAQGQANIQALLAGAAVGSPNQVTPFGTVSWSGPNYGSTAGMIPPGVGQVGGLEGWKDRVGMPSGPAAPAFQPGDFTMTSQFSPELQALFQRATQPLDLSGLPSLDNDANRARAEDATYRNLTRFLDERYGRQYETEQSRLRDQGIFPGMEAYTYANREFNRGRDDAYATAADKAIISGGMEADRSLRERQQMLAEILGQRALPFQELGSLAGLMPQAGGYGGGAQPAPILDAMQAQHGAANQAYGIEAGQYGSTLGAGAQLGSAALMAWLMSDRRLKSNIVPVGVHRLGIGIYEYDIFGERQRGVMADEVEKVLPQAVIVGPHGYKMVNYGLL